MTEENRPDNQQPMTKPAYWRWMLPIGVFIALLVLLFARLGTDTRVLPTQVMDKPLPKFELPNLLTSTQQITQNHLPESAFILNVWGSWCFSCYKEHPFLITLAQEGVPLIGVNYQDDMTEALKYLKEQKNPYKLVIQDTEGQLALSLGLTGAPESFLVDGQGRIRQHVVGMLTPENWKKRVQPCWRALQGSTRPLTDKALNRQISESCQ